MLWTIWFILSAMYWTFPISYHRWEFPVTSWWPWYSINGQCWPEHQWFSALYYFCRNTSSWWVYTWFHILNVIYDFLYSPKFFLAALHVGCDRHIFSLSMTHECHHMEISYFRNTRFLYLEIMGYFLWVRDISVFLPFDLLNYDNFL